MEDPTTYWLFRKFPITYYYRVLAKDYHGNESAGSDIISTIIVDVDGFSVLPTEYQLAQNIPNPFNPSTILKYGIPEKSYVSLIVYDLKGNIVKTIDSGTRQAGWHSYSWNGTTESGVQVPTGIYFARIQAGTYSQVVKMLFLK